MLLLEGISVKYNVQGKSLFDITALQIHNKQRIGLVGRNGSGKTTLLNIIKGEILPHEGIVTRLTSIELVPQFKNTNIKKSGGEKVKVALAKLFLSEVNVLVLDEPTNFLDIESLEALETLKKNYHGTIIL